MASITFGNILAFVQGYYRWLLDLAGLLPKHLVEQIDNRKQACTDCTEVGHCLFCGCHVPQKFYATASCSGERWKPLKNRKAWRKAQNV